MDSLVLPSLVVQTVEVKGRIIKINKDKSFIVDNDDIQHLCRCSYFCPIQEGDAIYALCKKSSDMSLDIVSPPFVSPPLDKETIVQSFVRCLHGTGRSVKPVRLLLSGPGWQ